MPQVLEDARAAAGRVAELLNADHDVYCRLGAELRERDPVGVATVARGSSDHAATYASYLIPLCTGRWVASLSPSLVTVLNARLHAARQLVLAISQSGASPDILSTFERARTGGAFGVAIVNDASSALAKSADAVLPQHAGHESIAATKSVLCTYAAIARLVAEWRQDRDLLNGLSKLPDVLSAAFEAGLRWDASVLKGVSHVYVLSRGLGLPVALEVALKLKETCDVHAEAFSTAEVRHGPREIVKENFLVLGLALQNSGAADVIAATEELKSQGARTMLVRPEDLPTAPDFRLAPMVLLQALYPWLVQASLALGIDPDHPRHLKSKVVKTV